ncbi:MAG: tyrosine-type recombinase/integrase [Acidobacteriota bacterium]
MLNLYRRHTPRCPQRAKGSEWTKCACPLWCDGELDGKRVRRSLKTRDWQRALRKMAALESPDAPRFKPVVEATRSFLEHCAFLESSTRRKYRNVMRQFEAHCDRAGIAEVEAVTLEHLDGFRAQRNLSPTTATKELQTLRQFLGFCLERRWVRENIAKRLKAPSNVRPSAVEPYTPEEMARIIAACDAVGRGSYERLRARAMILLLRHTGLRISDVATLRRDCVRDGQILLHTQKTGGTVYLPIPAELEAALAALPPPRGAGADPRFFFWNAVTSRRAVVGIAERSLAAVFKRSGVTGAHAHRFRHTLATDILARGGTEQDAADTLAISPQVVRRHYAKWSVARQQRITTLMRGLQSGTFLVQTEKTAVIH